MASFKDTYPHLDEFVQGIGWIEIGYDDWSDTFMRVLDQGGMLWSTSETYASMDDALRALDDAIGQWMEENL